MTSSGALAHIKVLDLSRVLAGPWAGQTLADMGADVIKVEHPQGGDDTRHWGPPYMSDDDGKPTDQSAYYLCANRGKKSVCIDLKTLAGQAEIRKLVQGADVLIENFKVGQMANFNLAYEDLARINPGLIYCSITGFGQNGPYAERPGYDFMIQAMSGLMSVTGDKGGEPQKVGVAVTDILTGLYSVVGILAALAERTISGKGQQLDMALMDVSVAAMANQASNYLVGGQIPQALGNAHPNIVPYQSFATEDGYCIVAVGNDSQFERFCSVISKPELAQDDRYRTNNLRVENRELLVTHITQAMPLRTTSEWLSLFEQANVPAGPINNLQQVFDDPQVQARGMQVEVPHPGNKDLQLVANPIKFSRTPVVYHRPPPLLGEHTKEVLGNTELD